MPSSFKSLDLFGSGPHRFAAAKRGELILSHLALDVFDAGSAPLGLLELDLIVRGRLIAASESDLGTLRDAITAQLLHPPVPGTLIDLHGRAWSGMSFISYQEADRVDRGRAWSVEYTAVFRRFDSL